MLAQAAVAVDAERLARFTGRPPAYLPVIAADPTSPAMLPTPESYEWFTRVGAGTSWENRLTLRTTELADEYEALRVIDRVSPTPLLMIVSMADSLCPADVALATISTTAFSSTVTRLSVSSARPLSSRSAST